MEQVMRWHWAVPFAVLMPPLACLGDAHGQGVANGVAGGARDRGIMLTCESYGARAHWGVYRLGNDRCELVEVIPGARFPVWSPDHSRLLVLRDGALCIWTPDGRLRSLDRLTADLGSRRDAAWSRDGAWVAHPGDLGSLAVTPPWSPDAGAQGASPDRTIVREGVRLHAPSFAPDGRIAVQESVPCYGAGLVASHIAIVGPEGVVTRVHDTPDTVLELAPTWSSDGGRIAFDTVDTAQRTARTMVYDLRSGSVTDPLALSDPARSLHTWSLGWSTGGDWLALATDSLVQCARARPSSIVCVGPTRQVEFRSAGLVLDSAWSPDGRQLAVLEAEPRVHPSRAIASVVRLTVLTPATGEAEELGEWYGRGRGGAAPGTPCPVEIAW